MEEKTLRILDQFIVVCCSLVVEFSLYSERILLVAIVMDNPCYCTVFPNYDCASLLCYNISNYCVELLCGPYLFIIHYQEFFPPRFDNHMSLVIFIPIKMLGKHAQIQHFL